MMNIVNVPEELQTPRLLPNRDRAFGFNIEEHFGRWARGQSADIHGWSYLPIYWWNNSAVTFYQETSDHFHATAAVQTFVDRLPIPKWYFTLSRGADGIYEKLPDWVIVFSAGGQGDFPIPHLSEINPMQANPISRSRNLLASFVGNIECGGPEIPPPEGRSSWDVDGAGARIRRKMQKAFAGKADCLIKQQQITRWSDRAELLHDDFCDVAERSWFGLAPRGYGCTSYRLYEMLHLGTIPVYIYDKPWLPYQDRLDWRKFAVLCHESELERLPERLRAISEAQRFVMIIEAQRLVPEYFTPDAVCQQILYYVGLLQ